MKTRMLPVDQQIKARLRVLSLDAAPALRAGLMPVLHIMEIADLGSALARLEPEDARN
jgi:hypothetical protein